MPGPTKSTIEAVQITPESRLYAIRDSERMIAVLISYRPDMEEPQDVYRSYVPVSENGQIDTHQVRRDLLQVRGELRGKYDLGSIVSLGDDVEAYCLANVLITLGIESYS